jgi:hypothetical protein
MSFFHFVARRRKNEVEESDRFVSTSKDKGKRKKTYEAKNEFASVTT